MSETAQSGEPVPGQVDPSGEGDLFGWTPPWVERYVPGVGSTFVHGYTGADAAKWKRAARNLALGGEPTPEQLAVAQVLWVCRTQPNGEHPTFRVDLQNARKAFEAMMERLPGKWVVTACQESDALAMEGYFPPETRGPGIAGGERLGEMLADEECWAALSCLSLKLYGVPLAENGQPLAQVLTHLERGRDNQRDLLAAIGALADTVRSAPSTV